jgi:2,3-bisphosphoglycerate-independent phosphoglycerate mutase
MALSLAKHSSLSAVRGPVVVVVMDGIGLGREDAGNAVYLARTPTLDRLRRGPSVALRAHGTAVGLPSDDDMGNSEVGHNALGAGRVFDQGAKLVNAALANGTLFAGDAWKKAVAEARRGGTLHLLGLLSDGNVHAHQDHLFALLRRAANEGVQHARIHALLDGRDVPETSALVYIDALEAVLDELRARGFDYRVASGGGRMTTTMDRYEADWSMVERGWKVHVRAEGRAFPTLREAVETLRKESPGIGDQNLPSFVLEGARPMADGDAVLLWNFRGDRAIEISRAFEDRGSFKGFDRGTVPNVFFAGMMQYDGDLKLPTNFLVAPPEIDRTLAEYLSGAGVPQLAISETQKFGHVTFFWNGNRSQPHPGETWVEIPSDLRPFEERPWMKAAEITDRLIDELRSGSYRHARVNYANGDMVGHTGAHDAAVLAVEAVDLQLARLLPLIDALGGALLVTADHGNADEMYEWDKKAKAFSCGPDGVPRPKTSHTLNLVPFHLYAPERPDLALKNAKETPVGLGNIAATVLALLGYAAPDGYLPSLV